jgi:hypothetical protein
MPILGDVRTAMTVGTCMSLLDAGAGYAQLHCGTPIILSYVIPHWLCMHI